MTGPPNVTLDLHPTTFSQFWGHPGRPWKINTFQARLRDPKGEKKERHRIQKASEKGSKIELKAIQKTKNMKKWNLTKTIVFTMVSAHLVAGFQQHFLSETKQKATWKSMLEFGRLKPLQNEPHAPKLTPKRVPKSIKNRSKSKPGSSVALFADPGDAWSLKMLTQGAKSESPDCKINSQNKKRDSSDSWLHSLDNPISNCQSCQTCKSYQSHSSQVCRSQRGPAAVAKP